MRLYTRTLVTYTHRARAHRRAGARPRHRPRHAVGGRPELDLHAARGRPVRERPADHLPRRQVRHRAVVRLRRHRRRAHATSSTCSTTRATPTPGPYQDETPDQLGLAVDRDPRRPRRSSSRLRAPQPDLPFVHGAALEQPGADRGRHRRAATAATRSPPGPYAITSVDPATGILLDRNPQWDPATDDVRTALPDQVVVRTGLSGLERDQALLAGSADVDISGTGVQAATTARLDGGRGRPRARPRRRRHHRRRPAAGPARRTSRRWTTRPAGPPWPRSSTGGRCRRRSAAPVNAVRTLAAVAARPARRARGRRPAAGPRRAPAPRSRSAGSPTASPPCWPCPTRRAASTSPRSSPPSWPRSGSRSRSGR